MNDRTIEMNVLKYVNMFPRAIMKWEKRLLMNIGSVDIQAEI